jgi:glutamate transport system permease protein
MTSPETASKPATRRPNRNASVLFDVPGPRARRRNHMLTVVFTIVFLGVLALLIWALNNKHQLDGKLWTPYTKADVWQN